MIRLKRAYEVATDDDGYRVLVERLWPRGVKKDSLRLDAWLKDLAPSAALRKWFAHDPAKWDEFRRRYRVELRHEPAAGALATLVELVDRMEVTLVYAARDEQHNSAALLSKVIQELIKKQSSR